MLDRVNLESAKHWKSAYYHLAKSVRLSRQCIRVWKEGDEEKAYSLFAQSKDEEFAAKRFRALALELERGS